MGMYLKNRKEKHKVFHEFSGDRHFYRVVSESGEEYNVSISVDCDCRYMGVQGIANGKVCSHIMAIFQDILDLGDITPNPLKDSKQAKRNACIRLVRPSNRKINEIRVSEGENKSHQDMKIDICKQLISQGKHFITEAIFESGDRADILVLDDFRVIEILNSEKEKSLEEKRKKYPQNLDINYIYC